MRTHRVLALARPSTRRSFAVLAVCTAITLSACGDSGPSIRAEPDTSTTSSSEPAPTTSTTVGTGPQTQVIKYLGLQFVVPAAWPVYDLSTVPRTCVRVDVHAVYLGPPGAEQDCPAHLVGHTEAIVLQPLAGASDVVVARATVAGTLNGLAVRTDPDPDVSGALTVVFPDLGVLAYLSYGASRTPADNLLAGFTAATG
jgi:hypothetical protein